MRQPIPFGKYLLLDRVSVGGMAEVFRAKSYGVEGFEKIIAIKRILPSMGEDREFIKMFIDEAKIVGQLAHANVCQIFELGRIEGTHFIAMEYIWGKDLLQIQNRLRKMNQAMAIPMACYVIAKVCEGLDYAHRKRDPMGVPLEIVHRDCSPQNILVSYEGEVKIIDFGIAKAASRSSRTMAGVLKGKFGYMSPEQVRGLPLDRRSDIFAVGTILYESITGERLFQGESDFSTLEKVRNVDIQPPRAINRSIPEEVEAIVMKALEGDVDKRYQWCSEMLTDLQRYLMKQDAVFTAKAMSGWMKNAFQGELERERKLLEGYKQIGPEYLTGGGKPPVDEGSGDGEGDPTLMGGPSFEEIIASVQAGAVPGAMPAKAKGRGRGGDDDDDGSDFAEEAPTEIFGEVETEDVSKVPIDSIDMDASKLGGPPATMDLDPGDDESASARTILAAPGEAQAAMAAAAAAPPIPGMPPGMPPGMGGMMGADGNAANMMQGMGGMPYSHQMGQMGNAMGGQMGQMGNAMGGQMGQMGNAMGQMGNAMGQMGGMQGYGGYPYYGQQGGMPQDGGGVMPYMPGVPIVPNTQPNEHTFGMTSSVKPLPTPSSLKAAPVKRKRPSIAKDIAIGVSIAVLVLGLFWGGKLLFFRGDSSAATPPMAPLAVTPGDDQPADIFIDGQKVGTATGGQAFEISLPLGKHMVRVAREGADACDRELELTDPKKLMPVVCTPTPKPPPVGKLVLSGITADHQVTIDGESVPTDKLSGAVELESGKEHKVVVKMGEQVVTEFAVNLAAGQEERREIPQVETPPPAEGDKAAADAAAKAGEGDKAQDSDKTASKRDRDDKRSSRTDRDRTRTSNKSPRDDKDSDSDSDSSTSSKEEVGYLMAHSTPWARVFIDGKDTGKSTPIAVRNKIELKPGKHKVTFVVGNKKFDYSVTIEAGKTAKLVKDLPIE